jgi:hypothetical protein
MNRVLESHPPFFTYSYKLGKTFTNREVDHGTCLAVGIR